jgi:FkbM family methyltransferase
MSIRELGVNLDFEPNNLRSELSNLQTPELLKCVKKFQANNDINQLLECYTLLAQREPTNFVFRYLEAFYINIKPGTQERIARTQCLGKILKILDDFPVILEQPYNVMYAAVFMRLGENYLYLGHRKEGLKYLGIVAELTNDAEVYFNVAQEYYADGNHPEYLANFSKALSLNPQKYRTQKNLDKAINIITGNSQRKNGNFSGKNDWPINLNLTDILTTHSYGFRNDMLIMKTYYGLKTLELLPRRNSPLYLQSTKPALLVLPADETIGVHAFLDQKWDIDSPLFFKQRAEILKKDICLIDIGANIGLFSRQCASLIPNINETFCYEPDPFNFELLSKNLEHWNIKIHLINAGLSSKSGKSKLFIDPENCGNYSLNYSAMAESSNPEKATDKEILLQSVEIEEVKWLSSNKPIFYKSDTQGHDEIIATCLSLDFWNKVDSALLELWAIPNKPYFDKDKFAKILDTFPNKAFIKNPKINISTKQIINYYNSDHDPFDSDLICWH